METVNTHVGMTERQAAQHGSYVARLFNQQVAYFEQNRFAMMALYIIVQSCVGSIACMHVLQYDPGYWTLALCAFTTMGANAFFIAQTNAKLCMITSYICIATNLLLIALV